MRSPRGYVRVIEFATGCVRDPVNSQYLTA